MADQLRPDEQPQPQSGGVLAKLERVLETPGLRVVEDIITAGGALAPYSHRFEVQVPGGSGILTEDGLLPDSALAGV